MLVKGPYSCDVKTWIILSNGKLKKQKLKLVVSIILWEKLNARQPPNVSRRLHNYSKLMYGHTYKLVSKYFKLTVYLVALCSFFSTLYVYVNTCFLKTFQIWKFISNKYVFSFLIKKRHYVMRKEYIYIYIYIYTDYLKYFSNSNVLENGFIYIFIY